MKVCPDCQRCFEDEILVCSVENHNSLVEGRDGGCEISSNYRLDFLCESSEFGEIYRSFNINLNKPCLIKILAPELLSDISREKFLGEARDISVIFHPNVARVFESGTLPDGSIYVVTEFLTEQTLRDYLFENGKPAESIALKIAEQIAEGLNAIHSLNVFHRNICPENIILTADEENQFLVKIQNLDFGGIRQKIINSKREENLENLKYFSPEQCAGRRVDGQTDVYSLGVVLYELLAGHLPFDASDSNSFVNKQLKETPPPIQIKNIEIRALLNHSLTDSLQRRKRLRLRSANIFARRLRYIQQVAKPSLAPLPAAFHKKNQLQIEPRSLFKSNDWPVEILADLPTEELPQIESIIGELLSESEIAVFNDEDGYSLENVAIVDWEQPDDIPPMPKILEKGVENYVSDFAIDPIFIDYKDSVIDSNLNNTSVVSSSGLSKPIEFSANDSWFNKGFGQNFSVNRKMLAAVVIGALFVLVFGGIWLNRQLESVDYSRQTVAQTSPNGNPIAKPVEMEKVEELITNNSTSGNETPETPDYQSREIKEKKVVLNLNSRNKKKISKTASENCDCNNSVQKKDVSNERSTPKKIEVIVVGSKSAEKNLMPNSDETGIFNRPRIVRKMKF